MAFVIGVPFYWCDGPQSSPGGYILRSAWEGSGDPPGTRVSIKPIGGEDWKTARVEDDPLEVNESVIRGFLSTGLNGCP